MMSKLYEITGRYKALEELLGEDELTDEAIKKGLSQIEGELEDKVTNIVRIIKNLDGDAKSIKEEVARLSKRRKTYENNIKRLREYIEFSLKDLNMNKVKTPYFTVSLSTRVKPKIEDESLLNDKYFDIEEIRKVNNKILTSDLKEGIEIKGVELIEVQSLNIR